MSEHPLLLFPEPQTVSRSIKGGGRPSVFFPGAQRQSDRLYPIFERLQNAFESRRVEVQQYAAGFSPEQALVIETVGSIEDFANAVRHIEGLDWLGEIDIDSIQPDDDFYDTQNRDRPLGGRLYFIMSDQRALDEMLSLWRRYVENPDMIFVRGLTKFRDVFLHLRNIRKWDVQDRLLETGVIEVWRENLEFSSNSVVRFEAELWFRSSPQSRTTSQQHVENLINSLEGRIISQCVLESITYHALLAELPRHAINEIITNPDTELVKCENIMFIRPVGQMASRISIHEETETLNISMDAMSHATGQPVAAILDGLPLANHRLLSNRLIVDDPDDWSSDYQSLERNHGTAMASLVVHGDLNSPSSTPLSTPVYIRPIMKPNPYDWHNPRTECIPEDVLVVDLIHRAVKRMFEGEQGNEPVAPSVKIINLSIGDMSRQFVHSMSPLARLIDWLSHMYNVLFIISAGNHVDDIDLGMSFADFYVLDQAEREKAIVRFLYNNRRNRKLLSPAESINGITVGATHHDEAPNPNINPDHIDTYTRILPSPVSAFGSGYRKSIKPDILFSGGRQLFTRYYDTNRRNYIGVVTNNIAPGHKVATSSRQAGIIDQTKFCRGTSNAAALATRYGTLCYGTLTDVFAGNIPEDEYKGYSSVLLKSMLIHGCSWEQSLNTICQILGLPVSRDNADIISQWFGYGAPNIDKVRVCTDQRATLLGFGSLSDEEAHVFRLPLPPSLSARLIKRRLTVTLAWLSPIATNTQKYRKASLWFEVENNSFTRIRCDADWQTVQRGTVQHEVFEGENAVPFSEGDSLNIKVNCRKDAARLTEQVNYAIFATLEIAEGVEINIYDEIRTKITQAVQIRPGNQV